MASRSAAGRDLRHLVQDRPAVGRLGIELAPRHGAQQQGHQHDQRGGRGHQPDRAPRCPRQDDGRDQHHRAGAGRHVGGPDRHGAVPVGELGDPQHQGRDRHRDDDEAQALEEAPDQQQVDAAGEGAEQAREAAQRGAEHDQAAMAEAVDGERDRHAADGRRHVDQRQQPAGLAEARAQRVPDRGDRRRHLADMGGGHHAGGHQQADQPPGRSRCAQYCTRAVMAPSTMKFVPLTNEACVPARNTTHDATSCGVPMRPLGLRASMRL